MIQFHWIRSRGLVQLGSLLWVSQAQHQDVGQPEFLSGPLANSLVVGRIHFLVASQLGSPFLPNSWLRPTLWSLSHRPLHKPSHNTVVYFFKTIWRISLSKSFFKKGEYLLRTHPIKPYHPFLINSRSTHQGPLKHLQNPFTCHITWSWEWNPL